MYQTKGLLIVRAIPHKRSAEDLASMIDNRASACRVSDEDSGGNHQ